MNDKFDELAKGLAQSVTRRGALKRFVIGLAGIALASLRLPNQAYGARGGHGGGNKGCNHCRYPYGCDKLPVDQQTGCFLYCNGICGGPR